MGSKIKQINEDELISLVKEFISKIKNQTVGIKPSSLKKEYNGTITNAHFYKMYGGSSQFVNCPWITFLAHGQKTTNGIYPIIFYDRKSNIENFKVGYGISERYKPDTQWNINFNDFESNDDKTFFCKLCLTIQDENDIEKNKHLIISCLNKIINDFHEQFIKTSDRAWLLTWNPDKWGWKTLKQDIISVSQGNYIETKYACSSRQPKIGDRVYILKLGTKFPKGIFASGFISKEAYSDIAEHTNSDIKVNCVKIKLDKIVDYEKDKILLQKTLKNNFPHQEWSPLSSGIEIKKEYIKELETMWANINNDLTSKPQYWLYAAGEKSSKWNEFYNNQIIALRWDYLGDLRQYKTQREIEDKIIKIEAPKQYPTNNAKANWEFVTKMKTGDIVFVKKGFEDILIGRGVVTSDYIYDNSRQEYKSIRKIKWTHNGHYKVNFGELGLTHWNTKVLTEISQTKFGDFCLQLEDIFMDKKISNINSVKHPLNLILYGPPGTGKTFETKNIMKDILCNNKIFVTQKTTKNITGDTPWWQAIALTMYKHNKNKKYKVAELEKLLKDYIKLKQNNTVKNKLWEQLQKHTSYTSETVFSKDRSEPFLFDKTPSSEWYLTDKGLNFIEDQLANELLVETTYEDKNKYSDFITFHQSYSYEEFIEGIKPSSKSGQIEYNIENGIFKQMCIKANSDPENNYVLIVDEINRGNISKIFGELITLIENDKRINPNGANDPDDKNIKIDDKSLEENSLVTKLPYSKENFGVPKNLYIIGTMNTSDRSIASIDIALRRRFTFKEIMPDSKLVADFNCNFKQIFERLNKNITILLDQDHQIGHSYFINTKYNDNNGNNNPETLKEIWIDKILPLLNEYFYCDWDKLKLIIPGFVQEITNVPSHIKNECEDNIYEFNIPDKIEDFTAALMQEKYSNKR